MSTDIQIGFPCPHFIVEEPVSLGSDRRTLITGSPVGSSPSVSILINNDLYVPRTGLYSQAFLSSSAKGPYRIRKCIDLLGPDANRLKVTVPAGTFEVSLPVSNRVSLEDLQKSLRLTVLYDYVEFAEQDGAIALKEKLNMGRESFIKVGGKGADALGFKQKGARGATLVPGWSLVKEETLIPSSLNPKNASARKIIFNQPIRSNPTIKATYTTLPSLCKRCKATFVENDYRFSPTGDLLTIENENLLLQACIKAVLTKKGSNPFHPSYGSKVMDRVGGKIMGAAAQQIKEDVMSALMMVKNIQVRQRQFQSVSLEETLYSVSYINVNASPDDPTLYFVDVTVKNASNKRVSLSIAYTAPGAVALTGSNGLSLGTNKVGL